MSIKTQRYPVRDIHLNTARIGSGPPLLLIHGWSNSWIGWTLLAQQLAQSYTVTMIDMPGFGDSDELPHYSIDIQAEYIYAFIQDYYPQPLAIIGASLGTIVTANLVNRYSHLTPITILIGAMFSQLSLSKAKDIYGKILKLSHRYPPAKQLLGNTVKARYTAYFVEKYLNNAYKFDPKMVDKYNLPGRKKMSSQCYVEMGLSAYQFNLEQILKHTPLKTLIMYGSNERYISASLAHSLLAQLDNPNLFLEIIPQAGHNPAYEQPVVTSQVIHSFITHNLAK